MASQLATQPVSQGVGEGGEYNFLEFDTQVSRCLPRVHGWCFALAESLYLVRRVLYVDSGAAGGFRGWAGRWILPGALSVFRQGLAILLRDELFRRSRVAFVVF